MPRTVMMSVTSARDPQVARMVGLSAAAHVGVLFVLLVVMPLVHPSPPPLVAYTVELTDSSSLGGRLAPGRTDLPMGARAGANTATEAPAKQGEPAPPPEPIAKAEPAPPVEAPKPVEPPKPVAKAPEPPKPVEPAVKLPSIEKPPPPKPEAKKPPEPKPEPKVEAKPEPKPEPKPEAKKPEPPKVEPPKTAATKTPEPPKTADATPNPTQTATAQRPTAEAKPVGKPTGKPEGTGDGEDAYASAADKWRTKGATGGGGGLGGTDTSPGPMGTPGYGGGGGGQVVGFEFLAYQQRVVSTVKGVWTNAAPRRGLVAKVRFRIAPNGDVSGVRLEQPSGDGVFAASVVRAVERANPLPPPPARYVNEFREFLIEFHSEEEGGQAAG